MTPPNGPQHGMTDRERAMLLYALAYLATGDGRHARGQAKYHLSRQTTVAIRELADAWRPRIYDRALKVGKYALVGALHGK